MAPKVLFFCRVPPPVSGEAAISRLIINLVTKHVSAYFVDARLVPGCDVAHGFSAKFIKIISGLCGVFKVRKFAKRVRPDYFYFVPSTSKLGLIRDGMVLIVTRKHVGRVVAHVHSGQFARAMRVGPWRPVAAVYRQYVDDVIVLYKAMEDDVQDALPNVYTHVIPNTIEAGLRISKAELRAKLKSRSSRRYIRLLYLSNMIREKGYLDVVSAMAEVNCRCMCTFVGGWVRSDEKREFVKHVDRLGVRDRVQSLGAVGEVAVLREHLRKADVLVLPTYYRYEAQPRVIIEALNAGVVIISTRVGGIPEMITDGVNGILVEPESPSEIATAIETLSNISTLDQMSIAARMQYEAKFDPSVVEGQLVALLSSSGGVLPHSNG